MQGPYPRIYCIISAGRPYVSSDLPVPVSRVSLGDVVIRCNDEMPGCGQLAGWLNRDKEYSPAAIGWLGGLAPRPFENDPLDPVTPDSRAGPVLAPFLSTIESCISAVLLWAVLGPALQPFAGLHGRLSVRGRLDDFEAGHNRTLGTRRLGHIHYCGSYGIAQPPIAIHLGHKNGLDESHGALVVLSIHKTEVHPFIPFRLPRLRVLLVRRLVRRTHHLPLLLLLPVQVYQDLPLHQNRGQ